MATMVAPMSPTRGQTSGSQTSEVEPEPGPELEPEPGPELQPELEPEFNLEPEPDSGELRRGTSTRTRDRLSSRSLAMRQRSTKFARSQSELRDLDASQKIGVGPKTTRERLLGFLHFLRPLGAYCRAESWALSLALSPLLLIGLFQSYRRLDGYRPGSAVPTGLEYFGLTLMLTLAFLHALSSFQRYPIEKRYRQWAVQGWSGKLCCGAPRHASDTEAGGRGAPEPSALNTRLLEIAAPGFTLLLHFVLLSTIISMNWPMFGEGRMTPKRIAGACGVIIPTFLASFWALVKLRIGIVGVCETDDQLAPFARKAWRFFMVSGLLQVLCLAKYASWYFHTGPAMQAALENGYQQTNRSQASTITDMRDRFGVTDITLNVAGMTLFISFGTVWVVTARCLDETAFENVQLLSGMRWQLVLISSMAVVTMFGFFWATAKMSEGPRMFEYPDGRPCDADCPPPSRDNAILCAVALEALTDGCKPWRVQLWVWLWFPVCILLGRGMRNVRDHHRRLQLPAGKDYHFFICHHQGSGGNQAKILSQQLTEIGCKVWYDNEMSAAERNLEGMKRGVKASVAMLIFLSGRKERDGIPDPHHGQYEGTFTRWFCHEEMHAAMDAGLKIVGVQETAETDPSNAPNFEMERERAMNGGEDGGPIHPEAARHLDLLKSVVFIPRRVQQHELAAYLGEIMQQGIYAKGIYETSLTRWADIKKQVQVVDRTLSPQKQFHFALCFNHDVENEQQVMMGVKDDNGETRHSHNALELGFMLADLGYEVDAEGIPENLQRAECLLVFSGGWQEKPEAPRFRALFGDKHCKAQIREAQALDMTIVGIRETERGWGPSTLQQEMAYCRDNCYPADIHCWQDFAKSIDWLERRYHAHEIAPFLSQIVSMGIRKRRRSLEGDMVHHVLSPRPRKISLERL